MFLTLLLTGLLAIVYAALPIGNPMWLRSAILQTTASTNEQAEMLPIRVDDF